MLLLVFFGKWTCCVLDGASVPRRTVQLPTRHYARYEGPITFSHDDEQLCWGWADAIPALSLQKTYTLQHSPAVINAAAATVTTQGPIPTTYS